MNDTVLLVVDVQTAIMEEHPYNEEKVIGNIRKLIDFFRGMGTEVMYVRHDDGPGGELEYGTKGWQIYEKIAPLEGERIFDKKYNSAFRQTGLKEYLDSKDIHKIILVGLQTEYCIDATCKSAFEQGFEVLIPEETNSTFDNRYLSGKQLYEFFNYTLWDNRFARVLPLENIIKQA